MQTRSSTLASKEEKVSTKKKKRNLKLPIKKKRVKDHGEHEKKVRRPLFENENKSACLHSLCDEIRPSTENKGAASLSSLCSDILMRNILPFVGKHQYRFVGSVNRQFRLAYFTLFSPITSYESVSTMKQADLCRQDIYKNPNQQASLLRAMVKNGRHDIVKLLFSWNICQDETKQLTATAAKAGHFELLQWLVRKGFEVNSSTIEGAAAYGDLAMFEWLSNNKASQQSIMNNLAFRTPTVYETAALHGHLDIIKWAHDKSPLTSRNRICSMAARNGHLHVLRWARSKNYHWDSTTCADAAMNGHLETLKWLHRKGCPWDTSTCFKAAQYGHEMVVLWAVSEGCPLSENMCDKAALAKNRKMLKISHSLLGLPLTVNTSLYAIKWGRLSVLKWLHENKCPWHKDSCKTAAELGYFEVLQWLHTIGCSWDADTMNFAAKGGHLEIIKWLRSNGCPWSEKTCSFAACGGDLDVLKWLRANDCPWDYFTYNSAVPNGFLHILEWARINGCPESEDIFLEAAKYRQLDVLKWARSHNFCWDDAVTFFALENRDLEMFNWARANGCPWNAHDSLECAYEEQDDDLVDWCFKNGVNLSSEICAEAALNGDFEFFSGCISMVAHGMKRVVQMRLRKGIPRYWILHENMVVHQKFMKLMLDENGKEFLTRQITMTTRTGRQ